MLAGFHGLQLLMLFPQPAPLIAKEEPRPHRRGRKEGVSINLLPVLPGPLPNASGELPSIVTQHANRTCRNSLIVIVMSYYKWLVRTCRQCFC